MDSELIIGWCKQLIPQSSKKHLVIARSAELTGVSCLNLWLKLPYLTQWRSCRVIQYRTLHLEGHSGQSCVHLYARILSTSFTSVSIFSVWCYSSVSISMVLPPCMTVFKMSSLTPGWVPVYPVCTIETTSVWYLGWNRALIILKVLLFHVCMISSDWHVIFRE